MMKRFAWICAAVAAVLLGAFVAIQGLISARRGAAVEHLQVQIAHHLGAPPAEETEPASAQAADTQQAVEPHGGIAGQGAGLAAWQGLLAMYDARLADNAKWDDVGQFLAANPETWKEARWLLARDIVAVNSDLIAAARRMAQRGGPVAILDLSKGFELELDHVGAIRDLARLLAASAIVSARTGDSSHLADDILAQMQLGDALAPDPSLISQLVRMACYRLAQDTLRDTMPPGTLSPKDVERLVAQLSQAGHRRDFARSLAGEAEMGLAFFDSAHRDNMYWSSADSQPMPPALLRIYGSPVALAWRNTDECAFANAMSRYIELADLPYTAIADALEEVEQEAAASPFMRPMTCFMVAALPRAAQAQALHETGIDIMRMGLLIERYVAEHGRYPDSLDAIAVDLGGKVPTDPFTGSSYRYKPSEESFTLYGVGRNCVDDGGRHDPRRLDVVWRGREEPDPE